MKKLFSFFLALVASAGMLHAESGTCGDNLTWDLSDGVLTISGSGNMSDYSNHLEKIPWYYNRETIVQIVVESGVTSIGKAAFFDCRRLTSVTISNSVTNIGDYAFSYCTGLTSITIPNSVTSIGSAAFSNCASLTSIVVDGSNIYYDSRDNCNAIISTQSNELLQGCMSTTIPNSVTSIGECAFGGCSGLTSVIIPNSITSIERMAFKDCSGLTSVTIPNSVTSIGEDAFCRCSSLTSVTIGNSVTSIGGYAFFGCTGLTSITIPNSVTSIGEKVFYGCTDLTTITMQAEIPPSLGSSAFNNTNISDIYVPCGSLNVYQSSWRQYVSVSLIKYELLPYTLSININHSDAGRINYPQGALTICDNPATIEAFSNYGYHFAQWSDGVKDSSRVIELTRDTTITAEFAKNSYSITTASSNKEWGSTAGDAMALYQEQVEVSAIANYGYYFTQWSDGNTDNPRTFVLTRDTTFTAEFAVYKSGTCGDNNMLTWEFNSESKTLVISGDGHLSSNYTFGAEAPTQTERLIIKEGVTSIGSNAFRYMSSTISSIALPSSVTAIGSYAFAGLSNRKFNTLVLPNTIISIGAHAFDGASYLQTIHFGSVLEEIGEYAFNGCVRVKQMTCLAEITPNVGTDGLSSISDLAELHVPNDYLLEYQIDNNWRRFVLKPVGAVETTVTDDKATVAPTENTAAVTWPSVANAATYELVIRDKSGNVVCTLIFNANGQLTSIAFAAPGRSQHSGQVAGFSFTVTGLDSGTEYDMTITAKDNTGSVIQTTTQSFTTAGGDATDAGLVESSDMHGGQKLLHNGQLLILRDGKTYNLQGQEVR